MAKAKLTPIFEHIHGGVGEVVFRRTVRGSITVMRKPDMSGVEWSPAQANGRERFRQAVAYARLTLADPQCRPPYDLAAQKAGRRAYGLMVADYMNPPAVEGMDLSEYGGAAGDRILIAACDDFSVVRVQVRICTEAGMEIESGMANDESAGSGRWVYRATAQAPGGTQVRVTATAYDRPGGTGALELTLTTP
jgi:hypothetical protein